jgi:MFS family permease
MKEIKQKSTRIAFIGVILSLFLYAIDATVVNVAVEHIQDSLHATYTKIQWIISIYQLGLAASLIFGAQLAYRFSSRKILIFGVSAFLVASFLCGIAPNANLLIAFRGIQGIAAGFIFSQVAIETNNLFGIKNRAQAFAAIGAASGVALVLGPLIGGTILNYNLFGFGWRSIFYINIPFGALAIILLSKNLSASTPLKLNIKRSFFRMLLSNLLLISAIALLIFGLNNGRTYHWDNAIRLALFGSVVMLLFFIWHELHLKRAKMPFALFDIAIFKERKLAISLVLTTLLYLAFGSFFLVMNVYQQIGLDRSALYSGASLIPFAIGLSISSSLSSRYAKSHLKLFFMTGAVLAILGVLLFILLLRDLDIKPGIFMILPSIFLYGLGTGNILPHLFQLAFGDDDNPIKSGIITTVQQVGLAMGIALIGGIFFTGLGNNFKANTTYSVEHGLDERLQSENISLAMQNDLLLKRDLIQCLSTRLSEDKIGKGLCTATLKTLPKPLATTIEKETDEVVYKSFNQSVKKTLAYMDLVLGVFFVCAAVLMREPKKAKSS